jgi:arginine repressor
MKSRRHHKILTALKNNEVDSQETLQQLLGQQGIEVNQATLSRDLSA